MLLGSNGSGKWAAERKEIPCLIGACSDERL